MKKQYMMLGISVLVFALLIGTFFWLNRAPESDAEAPDPLAPAIYVTGGENEPLPDSIEVTNESGTYLMSKIEGEEAAELRIPELGGASQDTYGLDTAGESARAMQARQIVVENASESELKNFGLDAPRASAQIFYLLRSSPVRVLFGDNAPGGEGVYAKLAGNSAVYLVDSTVAEPFFKPVLAYVSKSVTMTDPDAMGLDRVVISGSEIPDPIVIVKVDDGDEYGFSFGTHEILSPVSASLDFTARQALISLYGLTAIDAVAADDSDESLERYGLLEPALTASVTGPADKPEMSFTLRVSAPDENGNVHVIKSGSKIIYEVPESVMPWTKLRLFDYMEKTVIMPDIETLSTISITLNSRLYTFALSEDDAGELAVTCNGKAVDTKEFRTFYQNLTAAEYDAPTDETIESGTAPLSEIRYTYRLQNRMDTVRFYAGPARRNLVTLNGGTPYLCMSSYLTNLETDLSALLS